VPDGQAHRLKVQFYVQQGAHPWMPFHILLRVQI
jgi:hypothetical protein